MRPNHLYNSTSNQKLTLKFIFYSLLSTLALSNLGITFSTATDPPLPESHQKKRPHADSEGKKNTSSKISKFEEESAPSHLDATSLLPYEVWINIYNKKANSPHPLLQNSKAGLTNIETLMKLRSTNTQNQELADLYLNNIRELHIIEDPIPSNIETENKIYFLPNFEAEQEALEFINFIATHCPQINKLTINLSFQAWENGYVSKILELLSRHLNLDELKLRIQSKIEIMETGEIKHSYADLSYLENLPKLENLDLSDSLFTILTPTPHFPDLKKLNLANTENENSEDDSFIKLIQPDTSPNLEELIISGNLITLHPELIELLNEPKFKVLTIIAPETASPGDAEILEENFPDKVKIIDINKRQ